MKLVKVKFDSFEYSFCYITKDEQLRWAYERLEKSRAKVFGLDLETGKVGKYKADKEAGLDPYKSFIRLCQIYDTESKIVYVFDCRKCEALKALAPIFKYKKFIAHYAIFEAKHLTHAGIVIPNLHCSQIMAQFVYNAEHSPFEPEDEEDEEERPDSRYYKKGGFGLDNLVGQYFGVRISKAEQVSNWNAKTLTKSQVAYAALDAVLTYELGRVLMANIVSYKMKKAYELYQEMVHVVAHMELSGMKLDAGRHKHLINEWTKKKEKLEKECSKYFGEVNLRSSKQLDAWVKEYYADKPKLLAAWPRSEKTQNYSFNKTHLADLPTLPPIEALLAYRKYATLLSTFGESLQSKVSLATGRLHGSFVLGETRTGRLSSRNPNLQNMPARDDSFRHIFTAPQGSALVVADFSQIEIRVGAELSRDPVMLEAFENGIDLHKKIVSVLNGKKIEDVTKEERQLGKAVNFGLMFGMGATKLAKYARASYGVSMSEEEARRAWEAYHSLYSVYSDWCKKQRAIAEKVGFARTPLGKMRRLLPEEVYTKAVNTPVQGGAAEVSFKALCILRKLLAGRANITCTVHDEIIVECKKERAATVAALLTKAMEEALLYVFPDATTNGLVDAHIGLDWSEAKNPPKSPVVEDGVDYGAEQQIPLF